MEFKELKQKLSEENSNMQKEMIANLKRNNK